MNCDYCERENSRIWTIFKHKVHKYVYKHPNLCLDRVIAYRLGILNEYKVSELDDVWIINYKQTANIKQISCNTY